jgi:hypothetical protein
MLYIEMELNHTVEQRCVDKHVLAYKFVHRLTNTLEHTHFLEMYGK